MPFFRDLLGSTTEIFILGLRAFMARVDHKVAKIIEMTWLK